MSSHNRYTKNTGHVRAVSPMTVRFSDEEKRKLSWLAAASNMSVSAYVRRKALLPSSFEVTGMMGASLADEVVASLVRGKDRA